MEDKYLQHGGIFEKYETSKLYLGISCSYEKILAFYIKRIGKI